MIHENNYRIEPVPWFDARGLQRCMVPGVGLHIKSTAIADFWRQRNGTIKLRVAYMSYVWSFDALLASGAPVPDDQESMDEFTGFVSEELYRWMTEDAADLRPFDPD